MIEKQVKAAADKIRSSKKYRDLDIPFEIITSLIIQETTRFKDNSQAIQSAKRKLHNIIAPYLDTLDYAFWNQKLASLPESPKEEDLQNISQEILSHHDSTRERLPYMVGFYQSIRRVCPQPNMILDLACGLNPFALPFMGFKQTSDYYAYDIHTPRVELINRFFSKIRRTPLAEIRDVFLNPPEIKAEAAFFFKEAHRMEKRQAGASRALLQSLHVKYVFLSLPNHSLGGKRDLRLRMRTLANSIFAGESINEIFFPVETIYWVERSYV